MKGREQTGHSTSLAVVRAIEQPACKCRRLKEEHGQGEEGKLR